VVHGDAEARGLLLDALTQEGYRVDAVEDGAQALIRLHAEPFAAIIMDHDLPGVRGVDLLPGLRLVWPEIPVLMICTADGAHACSEAVGRGASGCLAMPFRMEHLLRALRRAISPEGLPTAPRLVSGAVC
jgi:DNA-binding response OmpR family regulator